MSNSHYTLPLTLVNAVSVVCKHQNGKLHVSFRYLRLSKRRHADYTVYRLGLYVELYAGSYM